MKFKDEELIYLKETDDPYDFTANGDVYEKKYKHNKTSKAVIFLNSNSVYFIKKSGFMSKEKIIKYNLHDIDFLDKNLTMFTSRLIFKNNKIDDEVIINFYGNQDAEQFLKLFEKNKSTVKESIASVAAGINISINVDRKSELETFVTGMKYEGRAEKFNRVVKKMVKEKPFYQPYDGYTGSELREELEIMDTLYEVPMTSIPGVYLEKEDDNPYDSNAIKVLIDNKYITNFHVGYIPAKHAKKVRDIMKARYKVKALATGGNRKTLDYDDKIETIKGDFSIRLTIYEK